MDLKDSTIKTMEIPPLQKFVQRGLLHLTQFEETEALIIILLDDPQTELFHSCPSLSLSAAISC